MSINPNCLQGYKFINKFIEDYEKMKNIGFDREQILKMLATQKYVQDFVDTPEWLVSVKKLPKGYKWSDGAKCNKKRSKKADSETYVFLSIDNDLYIKGLLDGAYCYYDKKERNEYEIPTEYRIIDNRICVIKDWRNKKDYKVNSWIGITPFFENSLSNFWKDNGGNMSYIENN